MTNKPEAELASNKYTLNGFIWQEEKLAHLPGGTFTE